MKFEKYDDPTQSQSLTLQLRQKFRLLRLLANICVNSNSDYTMRARGVLKGYKEIYISKIAKIGLNNFTEYVANLVNTWL